MKITKYLTSFAVLLALMLAPAYIVFGAGSAGISLSPQAGTYKVGQTLNLIVTVNPGTEKIDMVRAKLTYPADLLQMQSFTTGSAFGFQAGGNGFDNTAGTLSWGAGAAGGITSTSKFGTAVFKVLKTGDAKISVTSDSLALSAGENKFNGQLSSSAFSLLASAPLATQKANNKTTVKPTTTTQPEVTQSASENNIVDTQIAQNLQPNNFMASLANQFSLSFLAKATAIIVALILILLFGNYVLQNKNKNVKS